MMQAAGIRRFIEDRWTGRIDRHQVLWRDMLITGSLVNLLLTIVAMMLLARGSPVGVAVMLHFAALPYNLFLLCSIWRWSPPSVAARGLAVMWFLAMLVI